MELAAALCQPPLALGMTKDEFELGARWALRPSQTLGMPAQKVELVLLAKGGRAARCKVRHVEGELKGLEEFVYLQHLRCPWKDWGKVERDERNEQRLTEYVAHIQPVETVVIEAARQALRASGEDVWIEGHRGYTRWNEDPPLERLAARAGVEGTPWRTAPAFRDRKGDWYIPDGALVDLAIAFARAEPETVHLYLDLEDEKALREGFWFDEGRAHERYLKSRPAAAIARQWAGGAQEHRHLHDELMRLRTLLWRAVNDLRDCGQEHKARNIERAFRK